VALAVVGAVPLLLIRGTRRSPLFGSSELGGHLVGEICTREGRFIEQLVTKSNHGIVASPAFASGRIDSQPELNVAAQSPQETVDLFSLNMFRDVGIAVIKDIDILSKGPVSLGQVMQLITGSIFSIVIAKAHVQGVFKNMPVMDVLALLLKHLRMRVPEFGCLPHQEGDC
jgi:hypothetical protein